MKVKVELKEVFVNTQEIRILKTRSTKPKCVLERNGPNTCVSMDIENIINTTIV